MRTLTLSLFLLLFSYSFGQSGKDSLLLLNGKSIRGEITSVGEFEGDSVINYNYTKKNGKVISEMIRTNRVYSYTWNGNSSIVYRPNAFLGDYLTIGQTKDVTIGSYDARQTFKPHVPFWTGFALGLGASMWDTYLTKKEANDSSLVAPKEPGFFKSDPSVFPFFVPVVLSVSWSFPTFKLRENKMIHKNYLHNENYYRGYHRIAKQKRMLGALFGSLSGVALGMITFYVLQ